MVLHLLALTVIQVIGQQAQGDSTRLPLSAEQVRALCTSPVTGSRSAVRAIRALCAWRAPAPESVATTDMAPFADLANASFSFRDNTITANIRGETSQESLAPSAAGPAPRAQEANLASSSSSSVETALLFGMADFVIQRAQLQFQTWVLPTITRRVCPGKTVGTQLATGTCAVLADTITSWTSGSGGVLARLAVAARSDLDSLPARLVKLLSGGMTDAAAARALLGWEAGYRPVLAALKSGSDLDDAIAEATEASWTAQGASTSWAPMRSALARDLRLGTDVAARTLILNEARASQSWRPDVASLRLALWEVAVRGARGEFRATLAAIGSAGGPSEPASAPARKSLVAEAAWRIALVVADTTAGRSPADPSTGLPALLHTLVVSVTAQKYWEALATLRTLLDRPECKAAICKGDARCEKSLPVVLSALGLIADLAQSPSADAVRAALMAYAAPPTSFLEKRARGGLVLYLNAYLGGAGGTEWVRDSGKWTRNSPSLAAYLPVGIELDGLRARWLCQAVTFGLLRCRASRIGVFGQIVDLGALASWRFRGDDVSHAPEVRLAQVLSPGAYVLFHFGRVPLTLGVGGALTPALRTLKRDTTTAQATARRLGAFLAFDVPLFTVRLR